MDYSGLSNEDIVVNKKCDLFLSNIQRCLHECSDTKKYIEIKEPINVKDCVNVYEWMRNIKDSIRLKVDIKNLELKAQLNLNTDGTMTNLPNAVSLNSDLVSGLHNLNLEFSKNGSYELIILQKENEKSQKNKIK